MVTLEKRIVRLEWRSLAPALAFAGFAATIAFGATMAPPAIGEMAVVFSPFTDEETAWSLVVEAGGLIVAPTTMSNIVVAYGPDPDFKRRLQRLGALFFVAARGLCVGQPRPTITG